MTRLSRNTPFIACVVFIAASLCGCTQTSLFHRAKVVKAEGQNPAAEIISLWQPAKGPGINRVQGRGLAGQILFFTRGSAAPAVVDGDVRVYLFDNQGTPEEQSRPIWQFDFPAQDWQTFAQLGALGPAYNVFVPYPKEGQKQVECAIQIRFTPKDGPVVFSEMTSVTLPGRIDAEEGGFLPEKPSKSAAPEMLPTTAHKSAQPLTRNTGARLGVHSIRQKPAGGIEQASYTMTSDEHGAPAAIQTASDGQPSRHPLLDASSGTAHPLQHSGDARLHELEQTVRDLMQERAQATSSRRPIATVEAERPHPESEEGPAIRGARRFKLSSTAHESRTTDSHPMAARTPIVDESEIDDDSEQLPSARQRPGQKSLSELLDNSTW